MTHNDPNTTTVSLPVGTTTVSISDQVINDNFDNFNLDRKILKGIYRYGWEKTITYTRYGNSSFY